MTITEITPRSYMDSAEHRKVCDAVMAKAGVTASEVARVDRVGDMWHLTVWLRDANGRRYCEPGTNEVAKRVVTVPVA